MLKPDDVFSIISSTMKS